MSEHSICKVKYASLNLCGGDRCGSELTFYSEIVRSEQSEAELPITSPAYYWSYKGMAG